MTLAASSVPAGVRVDFRAIWKTQLRGEGSSALLVVRFADDSALIELLTFSPPSDFLHVDRRVQLVDDFFSNQRLEDIFQRHDSGDVTVLVGHAE